MGEREKEKEREMGERGEKIPTFSLSQKRYTHTDE